MTSLSTRMLRNLLGVMGTSRTPGRRQFASDPEKAATLGEFVDNPLAALGIVIPSATAVGGMIGAPIARGLTDTITGRQANKDLSTLESGMVDYKEDLLYKLQKAREKEEVERNMMAVQKASPHLYNQVMAGRRLPQGSVVLGGQPRQDLMEELATHMGSLPDPDPVFK